jgi:hypothetical protein
MAQSDDMQVILEAPMRTLAALAARLDAEGIDYQLQRPPGSGGG